MIIHVTLERNGNFEKVPLPLKKEWADEFVAFVKDTTHFQSRVFSFCALHKYELIQFL